MFTPEENRGVGEINTKQEQLTDLDLKILDVSNLINQLEKDLNTPMDPSKAAALLEVLKKEKARKDQLLEEKFANAKPTYQNSDAPKDIEPIMDSDATLVDRRLNKDPGSTPNLNA